MTHSYSHLLDKCRPVIAAIWCQSQGQGSALSVFKANNFILNYHNS